MGSVACKGCEMSLIVAVGSEAVSGVGAGGMDGPVLAVKRESIEGGWEI